MKRIWIDGVGIDDVSMEEALERALECDGETKVIFTPNAVMLDAARRDAALAELLSLASLSLADGVGAMLAARRKGTALRARIAGIDFGEALLARAEREGLRVFLLGGREGIAASAAARLRERYPSLCICGTHWGYFDRAGEENRELLSRIRLTRADVLIVCLGFPLQEQWIRENLSHLSGVRTVAGLGGALDVWSGSIKRAPRAFSRVGLEWAWRMAREPRRLKHLPSLVRVAMRRR